MNPKGDWPPLFWTEWKATCETLHRWMQIVGKVKLQYAPFLNEWWETGFHLSARGLTTGAIPADERFFEVRFDFIAHQLQIDASAGRSAAVRLFPRSVSDFYAELMSRFRALDIDAAIHTRPVETEPAIPFEQDHLHASYDGNAVQRWWRALASTTRVLERFRSTFVGKSSPILFFWGSFDLSCTRFSGRQAQMPKFGPRFYRIAEDQENCGCGFWPGNPNAAGFTYGKPAFYAYFYPRPQGFSQAQVEPPQAIYNRDLSEFILDYEHIRRSSAPDESLLNFFQSAYAAGAKLAHWDRPKLEQSLESLLARAAGR